MRTSLSFFSPAEQALFNAAIFDVLRAVAQLPALPLKEYGEANGIRATFKKSFESNEDGLVLYDISVSYYHDVGEHEIEEEAILHDIPYAHPGQMVMPRGCNVEDCIEVLYTEVAKLAYAMTGGKIMPTRDLEEGVDVWADRVTYEFRLEYRDEQDNYSR